MMELRTIQQDAGLGKGGGDKVDWMYEGPAAEASEGVVQDPQVTEDYLLGKEFKPVDNGVEEVKKVERPRHLSTSPSLSFPLSLPEGVVLRAKGQTVIYGGPFLA